MVDKRANARIDGKPVRIESRCHSWDRFVSIDTDISWPCFQALRDAPPEERNKESVRARFRVPESTFYRWITEHMWKERIAAFDRWRDRRACRIPLRDHRAMHVRHAELANGLVELAAVECRKMLADAKRLIRENRITPSELRQIADAAVKLGRLVHGDSTENVKDTSDLDLSALSSEELSALSRLQAKARKHVNEEPTEEAGEK